MITKRKIRRKLERDLRPFHITNDEIDAILEQFGFHEKNIIVFNTRELSDEKKKQ